MAKRPRKYGGEQEPTTNTLLVDGNALFKRGFFGAKNQYNNNGEHIGGVYQFITVIRKLLKEELYHRVFVFWDGKFSGRMRYDIYTDYKISRNKDFIHGTHPVDEEEVREKFLIKQYLEELFIRQLMDNTKSGVEADDFIAYYCVTKKSNEKITICTSDRDLCQLINKDIKLYLCDIKDYITDVNYQNHFKHNYRNSKLIKIIGGDASDDIIGIEGVKEKTLLNLFPELAERKVTLDEILESAKKQQYFRIDMKKKPLKTLTNIIERNTTGIQGKEIYEINEALVDLSKPLVDKPNRKLLKNLKLPIGDITNRGIKNVYTLMKRDGIDKQIYNFSTEYLLPFKELIEREKKQSLILNNK
jgi:5'-3' exonuclease